MPYCRDCGFEVEEEWVACPKCGSAISSSPVEEEATVAVSESESQEQQGRTLKIMLIGLIFILCFAIVNPGDSGMSLIEWAGEECNISSSIGPYGEELDSYCKKKHSQLTFYSLIIVICIVSLMRMNREPEKARERREEEEEIRGQKNEEEQKRLDELREKRAESIRRNDALKAKRKAERRANPVRYYTRIAYVISICLLALSFSLIIDDGTTNEEGVWVVRIDTVGEWSGHMGIDSARANVSGVGDEEYRFSGREISVSVTKDNPNTQNELCVTLVSPAGKEETGCTRTPGSEVILPQPIETPLGGALATGIVLMTASILIIVVAIIVRLKGEK